MYTNVHSPGRSLFFDFFDLTQIIFHKNLRKLLNIKIDAWVKFQIKPNEKREADFLNFPFLWCHQESNRGHKDFQSFALPTEL